MVSEKMNASDNNDKKEELIRRTELALRNNIEQINRLKHKKRFRLACITNSRLGRLCSEYPDIEDRDHKLDVCGEILDLYDCSIFKKSSMLFACLRDDIRLLTGRFGRGKVIDRSGRKKGDYYSVASIIKNEARFMREFVLFNQAVGADRIYIYDNGSTDDLLSELEPFIDNGLVIYIKWPGSVAHAAAYRNAIQRTKNRTKWLALIDADEFLFSPKGRMPDVLKDFEQYPGVGANWLLFGPNGHDRRPEGLVMDNYTSAIADHDSSMNCHIKSIIQPKEVLLMNHTHYAYYKKGRFAVDECRCRIGNRNAYAFSAGKAFTAVNHNSIFRINHYKTKSMEDLREKCKRGYADGAPNAVVEDQLLAFQAPMAEDLAIKPYADIVRELY